MKKHSADVIVIGAGPAGISCAMQLKRHGIEPLLIERSTPGGLLHNASVVENFPGFPEGIPADDLITRLKNHITSSNIKILIREVVSLRWDRALFEARTASGSIYSPVAVVASGTDPVVPAGASATSPNVFYEITGLKGMSSKKIAIIGAGDAAFDYALQLAERDNRVSIFNRGTKIRALPLLVARAGRSPSIKYYENHTIETLTDRSSPPLLSLRFNVENYATEHNFDCLIFATGRVPALGFIHPSVGENREALVSAKKLFFIGDVMGGRYRQAAIAAGEGIRTAMEISHESYQKD